MTSDTKRVPVTLPLADIQAAEAEAKSRGLSREKVLAEKFAGHPQPVEEKSFALVELALIDPNPYQPRQHLNTADLMKLARGIDLKRRTLPDTCGLMQVPIARRIGERVQLAFGHRRQAAFEHLHYNAQKGMTDGDWSKMALQIADLTDEEMYDFAARENSDRADINDIEKARSIQRAQEELGWSLTRAANAHGLSKSAGSNLVRLLQLPEVVQQLVIDGALGQRHARELLRLLQHEPPLLDDCLEIAQRAVDHEMTVAQVERTVTNFIENWAQAQRIKTRAQHQETRYCRFCGRERLVNGNQIDLNDSLTCEGCQKRQPASLWSIEPLPADEPEADQTTCARCGVIKPGGAWWHDGDRHLCARCSPYGQTIPAPANEPRSPGTTFEQITPSEPSGEFDCPRCSREKIVRTNGGAWCLGCDAKWVRVEAFHAERTSQTTPQAQEQAAEVVTHFQAIVQQATPAQLEHIKTWLDDLAAFINQMKNEPLQSEMANTCRNFECMVINYVHTP